MMKTKAENKQGFTLAEVLITLGIIGIVAAMTIPTLMANYQKTQYVAGLKKGYSEITEALKLMANDNGCPGDLKCSGVFSSSTDPSMAGSELKKYFKLAKDCGSTYNVNDEKTKCMTDSYVQYLDGSGGKQDLNLTWGGFGYRFITADGFAISLINDHDNCNDDVSAEHDLNSNLSKTCGDLYIDVNGFKGPNIYGRDIFKFYITNGRGPAIYPYNGDEARPEWSRDTQMCPSNANYSVYGEYCVARIMNDSWQMNY